MDLIKEIVVESSVVILSGGIDKMGVPLLTFPTDSADLMDVYSTHDIFDLIKVFIDLSGGKVAVLADLQNGWNSESTDKFYHLLEKLQTTRKGCLTSAYIIRPPTNNNHIYKIPASNNKKQSTNIIKYLDKLGDLHLYIDKSQLTVDYGGTLQYNHVTWVDFQRTYLPLITKANVIMKSLPYIEDKIHQLQEVAVDKCQDSDKMFTDIVRTKYEKLLNKHNVRSIVEDCQDCVDRLEHPDGDPTLVQIHVAIVTDTKHKINKVMKELEEYLDHLEDIVGRTRDEHALFAKLKDCKDNTKEVEETIELMTSQADGLPLESSSEEQAKYNRDVFNTTVLAPSQDIMLCATSILQDLNSGNDVMSTANVEAEEIAKRMSDSIQPFINHLNHLNELYTRIHLFHVIVNKTKRWNTKSCSFISRHLLPNQNKCSESSNILPTKLPCTDIDITECMIPKLRLDIDDDIDVTQLVRAPSDWIETLKHFFKKHPPPKKKHVRLLNKFVPHNVEQQCRTEAEVLAERTLFLIQFLMKDQFKLEDILMIQRWRYHNVDFDIEQCVHVSQC